MLLSLSFEQFAQQYGYIRVDWARVQKDVDAAKKELEKRASKDLPKFLDRVHQFVADNVLLAGGFSGGFLLGLASA